MRTKEEVQNKLAEVSIKYHKMLALYKDYDFIEYAETVKSVAAYSNFLHTKSYLYRNLEETFRIIEWLLWVQGDIEEIGSPTEGANNTTIINNFIDKFKPESENQEEAGE